MQAPHDVIELTHAKILVSKPGCQVSWGYTNSEVVDH